MQIIKLIAVAAVASFGSIPALMARTASADAGKPLAVGPQYDTAHVYLQPSDVDRFTKSFLATFGGTSTKQVVVTVTPTPSTTSSQLLLTPVGTLSVFGFQTPVPYPFGLERTGYLVTDLDAALRRATKTGAGVLVSSFPDPIGRDAVIQWPGGVNMQLYWHPTVPSYPSLRSVPDNRVYVPAEKVHEFVADFTRFAHGKVVSDDAHAPGSEIGRPGTFYRRVRIVSPFGGMTVLVTDGHLPYPYGHEVTGYAVADLTDTIAKAKRAGATVLARPSSAEGQQSAMLEFPGGYIAEVHAGTP